MAKSKASDNGLKRVTECPFSLEEFREKARGVPITIDGLPKALMVKEFSTGSFGWFSNEKLDLMVGGEKVRCQMNFTLVVVGSKEAPAKKVPPKAPAKTSAKPAPKAPEPPLPDDED